MANGLCMVPGCDAECVVCGAGSGHSGWLKCRCQAHARTPPTWVCESLECQYENVLSAESCVACGGDHPTIPESIFAPPPPPPPMPGVNVDEVLPPVDVAFVDANPVEPLDANVELVMAQTGIEDRDVIVAALQRNAGDIVNTILEFV